ncbi:hypothetical protein BT63DRAFT_375770 [Microthyrium microscopicum]|uniref:Iron-sulfur assembly protein 1 n=1 Tax=Microthyrium microscopicum TaxID=703497 RepID=A0A6A6U8G4_9PEZI|nr:hypothetical protein BT63DRAFT_375770 [Microthyrium microscopicum]
MTESSAAYRPKTLDTSPPSARNVGVPESSIAGGLEGDARPPDKSWPGRAPPVPESAISATQADQTASISEQEAQQTKPVYQPTKSLAPSTRPAGKSRLRARKAAMTLTPTAVEHLRQLLDSPDPKLIRVGVKNKGCSGSAYSLEYVDKPAKFDEQVEQDGVKVLIDSKALIKVIGSEMDWVEDKLSARFTFRNPNITDQCGCGESFSVG